MRTISKRTTGDWVEVTDFFFGGPKTREEILAQPESTCDCTIIPCLDCGDCGGHHWNQNTERDDAIDYGDNHIKSLAGDDPSGCDCYADCETCTCGGDPLATAGDHNSNIVTAVTNAYTVDKQYN